MGMPESAFKKRLPRGEGYASADREIDDRERSCGAVQRALGGP